MLTPGYADRSSMNGKCSANQICSENCCIRKQLNDYNKINNQTIARAKDTLLLTPGCPVRPSTHVKCAVN